MQFGDWDLQQAVLGTITDRLGGSGPEKTSPLREKEPKQQEKQEGEPKPTQTRKIMRTNPQLPKPPNWVPLAFLGIPLL